MTDNDRLSAALSLANAALARDNDTYRLGYSLAQDNEPRCKLYTTGRTNGLMTTWLTVPKALDSLARFAATD